LWKPHVLKGVRAVIRDPHHRRRVIIEPDAKRIERSIVPLFDSMARAAAELCDRYGGQELSLILDFAFRSRALAEEQTRKLREEVETKT
jgi:hypothetical protein